MIRWDGEVSKEVKVEKGVRQGCVISSLLFSLYSEFMIKEAMKNVKGIKLNRINLRDLRYADNAVLIANKGKQMQNMIDRLNKTCKEYGMEMILKNTKEMIMNKTEKLTGMQRSIMLNRVLVEQARHFEYLGSWITDDARSDEDIRARVGMAKAAF